MSQYHLTSTARTLYRVFIAPSLTGPSPFRLQTPFLVPYAARLLPQTTTRHRHFQKDVRRHALSDHYVFDLAIKDTYINYLDANGVFRPNVHLRDALRSFDKTTYHLLLVSPGTVDEFGESDPGDLPTCKVISKVELRERHRKKLDAERRTAQGKGTGPAPKNLELNWAIAGGDLKHRLEKLKEFLGEGRKVEVLIGPKRKGRQATGEESRNLLKAVKNAVGEVSGAQEVKEQEGVIGGVMTLFFKGSEPEEASGKKKEKDKGEEKRKRKERQEMKEERRRKAAEQDPRNKLKEAVTTNSANVA